MHLFFFWAGHGRRVVVGIEELLIKTERNLINPRESNPRCLQCEVSNLITGSISLFLRLTEKNCHKLGDLRTTEIYFLTVLETKSLKSWCFQGHIFSDVSQGESFLASSSLWWLQVFPSFMLHKSLLSSLCVPESEISLCLSLTRISIIGFRSTLNPG